MPIFGLGQKAELHAYETGYALAAEHDYQSHSSRKTVGKPIHASGFVAGFMYRAFVENDLLWTRQSTMSSEFVEAIELGWAAGKVLEAEYKGLSYEANDSEPNDEFLSPVVQMFTGNLEQESWRPALGYPGTFVSNCGRIHTWKGFRLPRLSPSHKYPHAVIPYGGNQPIHELVVEAWIGLRPKQLYLCHNNDNKLDARLCNLRHDTPKANAIDRYKNRAR